MAINQMYATTGRRFDPSYVDIINAQTPYLPALKRQEEADKLAKRELALREQEIASNEALAREEMEQQKKQARLGNIMGVANLGLRGGLGMYQYSEPFRGVVDKAIGGASDFLSGSSPSGASSYLGDAFSGGGTDWLSSLGEWLAPSISGDVAGEVVPSLLEYAGDAFAGSSPYESTLADVLSSFW